MLQWFYILVVFICIYLFSNIYWLTAVGLSLAVVEITYFLKNIDKGFLFYRYALLVALLQWILAPFIDYTFFNNHYLYYMYVPEESYMALVVPSLLLLKLGLSFFGKRSEETFQTWKEFPPDNFERFQLLGFIFLFVGVGSSVLSHFGVAESIAFVFFLLSNLKFVGGLIILYANHRFGVGINFFLIGWLFLESLSGGMFHELILWVILLLPFFFLKYKISSLGKVALLLGFACFVFMVQTVKADFRQVVWNSSNLTTNNLEVFVNLVNDSHEKNVVSSEDNLHTLNIRINQGWIISRILYFVPSYEKFAGGETIEDAVVSSIIPRVLAPNKQRAGGQISFERFTGLKLHGSTSMGMSLVGEAYANYGLGGSYIFMFVWGIFFGYIIYAHVKFSLKYPVLLFFIPWIFIASIKAETDLFTVLNYITKAYILLGLILLSLKYLGVELKR